MGQGPANSENEEACPRGFCINRFGRVLVEWDIEEHTYDFRGHRPIRPIVNSVFQRFQIINNRKFRFSLGRQISSPKLINLFTF